MPAANSLDSLTLQSLQKCLARLSGVAAGAWRVSCASPLPGGPADTLKPYAEKGAAVFLGLEGLPLFAVMLLNPAELECLGRAFTGHSFPRGAKVSSAELVMLSELGNIILNALLNPLVNSLKKSAMPTLPRFYEGPAELLALELAAFPGAGSALRMIPSAVELDCGGTSASLTLFSFLPEDYALEIERA